MTEQTYIAVHLLNAFFLWQLNEGRPPQPLSERLFVSLFEVASSGRVQNFGGQHRDIAARAALNTFVNDHWRSVNPTAPAWEYVFPGEIRLLAARQMFTNAITHIETQYLILSRGDIHYMVNLMRRNIAPSGITVYAEWVGRLAHVSKKMSKRIANFIIKHMFGSEDETTIHEEAVGAELPSIDVILQVITLKRAEHRQRTDPVEEVSRKMNWNYIKSQDFVAQRAINARNPAVVVPSVGAHRPGRRRRRHKRRKHRRQRRKDRNRRFRRRSSLPPNPNFIKVPKANTILPLSQARAKYVHFETGGLYQLMRHYGLTPLNRTEFMAGRIETYRRIFNLPVAELPNSPVWNRWIHAFYFASDGLGVSVHYKKWAVNYGLGNNATAQNRDQLTEWRRAQHQARELELLTEIQQDGEAVLVGVDPGQRTIASTLR